MVWQILCKIVWTQHNTFLEETYSLKGGTVKQTHGQIQYTVGIFSRGVKHMDVQKGGLTQS